MHDLEIVYLPPGELTPYENNARKHAPHDVDAIIASIEKFGFSDPIGIWSDKNIIVEGHGRQIAALQMGLSEVPCIRLDHMTDEQRRAYALAHNKTAELSAWDFGKLEEELAHLQIDGIDMSAFDFDIPDDSDGIEGLDSKDGEAGSLAERYLVPPFSVIYGNKQNWLSRKRAWVSFGIRSELGRGGTCVSVSRMDG